jgi:hypothetical protein
MTIAVAASILFGTVGTILAVWTKVGPSFTKWRAKRKLLREKDAVGLALRVKDLEDWQVLSDAATKRLIQFIEGTPDPFQTNPDGTPVVTGGLLNFMRHIEERLTTEVVELPATPVFTPAKAPRVRKKPDTQ